MSSNSSAKAPTPLQVASVVAFYMCTALIMIFVNKAVLTSSPTLPLLFLFLQLVIAVFLLQVAALFSPRIRACLPTRPELSPGTARKLTPVVAVNIIGLVFNTLCLRDVDASFFQIARGLVLPLTILVSSLSTHTTPSLPVLVCATLVTSGFLIGVLPASFFTLNASTASSLPIFSSSPHTRASRVTSLVYGVLSSLFIALHAVLIKRALPHVDGSTLKLAWWTNAGSAVLLFPCIILAGEPASVSNLLANGVHDKETWKWGVFMVGSGVTGVCGFMLCVAGLLSIKVTSPVTHMFSSAARGVLQTLLGVWLFKDILTVTRASSIFVILLGTVMYTWVKSRETSSAERTAGTGQREETEKQEETEERGQRTRVESSKG